MPSSSGIDLKCGAWRIVNDGTKIVQFGGRWADEHVACEKAVPRRGRDDPHRQPVFGVGAAIEVLDEKLVTLQIGEHALMQAAELRRGNRLIDAAPGNRVVRAGLVDDVLVARATAGVPAGVDDERAAQANLALAPAHRMLVEERHLQVPVHRPQMTHPLLFKAKGRLRARHRVVRLIQGFPPSRPTPLAALPATQISGARYQNLARTVTRRKSTGKQGKRNAIFGPAS